MDNGGSGESEGSCGRGGTGEIKIVDDKRGSGPIPIVLSTLVLPSSSNAPQYAGMVEGADGSKDSNSMYRRSMLSSNSTVKMSHALGMYRKCKIPSSSDCVKNGTVKRDVESDIRDAWACILRHRAGTDMNSNDRICKGRRNQPRISTNASRFIPLASQRPSNVCNKSLSYVRRRQSALTPAYLVDHMFCTRSLIDVCTNPSLWRAGNVACTSNARGSWSQSSGQGPGSSRQAARWCAARGRPSSHHLPYSTAIDD